MQVSSDMHTLVRLQQTLHVRDEICLGNFGRVWHSLMSLIWIPRGSITDLLVFYAWNSLVFMWTALMIIADMNHMTDFSAKDCIYFIDNDNFVLYAYFENS